MPSSRDYCGCPRISRIRLSLKSETRDGEKEIAILTNLPKTAASAKLIAEIYRKRWSIDGA